MLCWHTTSTAHLLGCIERSEIFLWPCCSRHNQRETPELTKPSQRAPKARIWLTRDIQCGFYFTETQYLLHSFSNFLVSFLFAHCPRYLLTPTNAHQLFLQIIEFITSWEITEISQTTGTWGTFVLLVGLRIAGVTSNPSVYFYFHSRKGNLCSPGTQRQNSLPSVLGAVLGVEQLSVISLKEVVESICCYLSEQFSSSGRIKSSHFNLLQAGTGSRVSLIIRLMKGRYWRLKSQPVKTLCCWFRSTGGELQNRTERCPRPTTLAAGVELLQLSCQTKEREFQCKFSAWICWETLAWDRFSNLSRTRCCTRLNSGYRLILSNSRELGHEASAGDCYI